MKKISYLSLSMMILLSAFCFGDVEPTGTEQRPIKLIQTDKKEIILESRMVDFKINENWTRKYGVIILSKIPAPIIKDIYSILVPFTAREIPGGRLFLIKPAEGKMNWGLPTMLTASNYPNAEYVVAELMSLKTSKVKNGTLIELGEIGKLKPGRYFLYVQNNKYAWDFDIEGVVQPEPKKSTTQNSSSSGSQNTDK
jgi:hypothetical protein